MQRFFRNIALFVLSAIGFAVVVAIVLTLIGRLNVTVVPAPAFSDSYSFNEKTAFMKKNEWKKDILVVGSSMCLNNFSGEEYARLTGQSSIMNVASWGLSVKDSYDWMKHLTQQHHPKEIIMISNYVDFCQVDKNIDFEDAMTYLEGNDFRAALAPLQHFNLRYYIKNTKYAEKVRNCSSDYEYLGFDSFGCVNLEGEGFHKDSTRWNDHHLGRTIVPIQYQYLDSICIYCKERGMRFTLVQSPYRSGLSVLFNTEELQILTTHHSRIEEIVKSHQHDFLRADKETWPDDLFVDGTHLNKEGAQLLTRFISEHVNH